MKMREIAPWRWGSLRRWHRDEEPAGGLRHQMDALHKEMDRLFDELSGEVFTRSFFPQTWGGELVMPDVDETEDEKGYTVMVELPGMDEEDVDITLVDRRLTIRGEKKQDKKEEAKDFYRRERSYGSFRRTLELPGEVDESKIEASFKKGVLTITLPKTKEAQEKIRHISVKAA